MKLGLTDKQYYNLLSLLQEQAEAPAAEPEKGTSDKQTGGQGYPAVGKWESGVTRGPGNQIGVTKWSDVVGSKLTRGKSNPLKEIEYTKRSLLRLMNEQTPIKTKKRTGRVYVEYMGSVPNDLVTGSADDPWYRESTSYNPGNTQYKTYWGETISIPNQGYKVELWTPSTNRLGDVGFRLNQNGKIQQTRNLTSDEIERYKKLPQDQIDNNLKNYKIDLNTNTQTYEYNPPTEGYLRKIFPDGTVKNIIDYENHNLYGCRIQLIDINDSENYNKRFDKDDSIMGNIINPGLYRNPIMQWTPKYGYWSYTGPNSNEGISVNFLGKKEMRADSDYVGFTKTKDDPKQDIQRFYNRKSYSGLEVPEGMNPNRYDEYLYRKSILEKFENWKKLEPPRPIYYQYFTEQEWKEIGKMSNQHDHDPMNRIESLEDLNADYISPLGEGDVPEFSYGIDRKSREAYFRLRPAIDSKYDPRIKYLQQKTAEMTHPTYEPGPAMAKAGLATGKPTHDQGYNELKTELDTLVKEKAAAIQELKMVWGYDYWKPSVMGKSFDEAWDKWGGLVMLGGNLLISLGTGGLASLFSGALSLTVRALIPVVTDIAFNGLIAAYQYNKGEDSQAFLSLVCAFLPIAKFGFNIGKINAEASLRLATKIKATEGLLQDANKLSEFIITLSEEEKYIFRNLMSLPKKQLAEGSQGIFKTLDDVVIAAKKGGTPIGRSSIRAWGPNALRELGIELVLPTVVDVVNQITRFVVDSTIKIQWTPESLKECQSKLKESMDAFIKSDGMLKTFMAIKDVKNDKPLLTLFKNAKTGDQAIEIFTTYTRNKINKYTNKTDEQIVKELKDNTSELEKMKNDIEYINSVSNEPISIPKPILTPKPKQ